MSGAYAHAFRAAVVARAIEVGDEQAAREFRTAPATIRRWRMTTATRPTQSATPATPRRTAAPAREVESAQGPRTHTYTAQELGALYTAGLSTSQLAALTGRAQSGISSLLRRHGVPMRTVQEGVALRRGGAAMHGRVPPTIIRDLLEAGMSITKIAATLGLSVSTVKWHQQHPPAAKATRTTAAQPGNPAQHKAAPEPADSLKHGFAENLTLLRGIHGLTAVALGRLIGVSPQTLSEWRSGRQHPGWPALSRVSDLFGVPVDLLTKGTVIDVGRFYFTGANYTHTHHRIRTTLATKQPHDTNAS